jgi:hypothetical protein
MSGRITGWPSIRKLCLIVPTVMAALLQTSDAGFAGVYIDNQAKILILSGYSTDVLSDGSPLPMKQELTPIHDRLNFIFQGFGGGLQRLFGAEADYLSESALKERLDLFQLARRPSATTEKGIPVVRDFVAKGKYTHLVVADVRSIGPSRGAVRMQVATTPGDGSVGDLDTTEWRELMLTQTDSELNNLRQAILRDFVKFIAPNAPKRVNVLCIEPRNKLVIRDYTDQLELERILSRPITLRLIEFYHTEEMQERGYRPLVDKNTYEFEISEREKELKCKPAASAGRSTTGVKAVPVDIPADYVIDGEVGVITTQVKRDLVELTIKIVRNLPPNCKRTVSIKHRFDPTEYYHGNGKYELSWTFSDKILLPEYKQAWMTNFENKSCSQVMEQ